jgi:hypothetical protein
MFAYGDCNINQVSSISISASGKLLFGPGDTTANTTFTVAANSWHFVGFTYAAGASTVTIYYDNTSTVVTNAYGALNTGLSPEPIPNAIGTISTPSAGSGCANGWFSDLIQDYRIYNRALSAAQIAAMYAGGK